MAASVDDFAGSSGGPLNDDETAWLLSLVGEAEQASIAAVTVARLQLGDVPSNAGKVSPVCSRCALRRERAAGWVLDAQTQPYPCLRCGRETLSGFPFGLTPGGGASTPEGGTRLDDPTALVSDDDNGGR